MYKDDKTPMAALMSGVVNKGFSKYMLKNLAFKADNNCINCGECVVHCPLNNIEIVNGKPQFGKNCCGCFSCLHRCPTEAINIKNKTQHKGRYICPDYNIWKSKNS